MTFNVNTQHSICRIRIIPSKYLVFLAGAAVMFRGHRGRTSAVKFQSLFQLTGSPRANLEGPSFARTFASTTSERTGQTSSEVNSEFGICLAWSCLFLTFCWSDAAILHTTLLSIVPVIAVIWFGCWAKMKFDCQYVSLSLSWGIPALKHDKSCKSTCYMEIPSSPHVPLIPRVQPVRM